MSLVGRPLADTPEEQVAPEAEYDLRVIAAEAKLTKAEDRTMIVVNMIVEGGDDYLPFTEWLVLPNDNDWEQDGARGKGSTAKMFVRNLKRFLATFGMDPESEEVDSYSPEDLAEALVGATGRALVYQDEYEGRINNKIRVPKLDV